MWEFVLALLLGIVVGTFTGLFPGIHVNLISVFILSLSPTLLNYFSPISLAIFIVSLTITHSFLDFIPSIFLGAPDDESFLSVLPGHELLKQGKGYEAVVLTLYGSLVGLLIILVFTPLFIFLLPSIQNIISSYIPYLLIFLSLYLIFQEDNLLLSLIIFSLAGVLGLVTFNLPIKEPLLPLLTGLFGTSSIILSLRSSSSVIQKQETPKLKDIKLEKKEFLKSTLAASISAPLCSFLPGIGSGHAATLGSEIFKQDKRQFLFLIGAINTIVISLSFVAAYSINKTRSGAAVAVKSLLKTISFTDLVYIIATIIITGVISFFIALKISKLIAKNINKVNYKILSIFTLSLLFLITIIFSNFLGFLVLITSTSLGIFAVLSNSKRINLMASLILPSIIFYLTN